MSVKEDSTKEVLELPEDYLRFANEYMPYIREESLGTYCSTWSINNWSKLSTDSQVRGPIFKTDEFEWNLLLYPTGNNNPQHISLFLENLDCKNGTATADICAQIILCVVDPTDAAKYYHQETHHRFDQREADYGFGSFMTMKTLMENENDGPFVVDDSVTFVAIVRLIKDPTGVLWHNFINYNSKEMTGYVGLFNQGATCYMNSLFQSLFFTNLYRKSVYQIPTENDQPESSIVYALQRLFYQLQFSDSAVSTTELTKSFGWNSIDSFMQHDVQEFNRLLQDNIEKKMKGTPAEDSIKELFVGRMKSYIKCINVEYESARSEAFYDIQLNVKGCKNLEESFKHYILVETLEGDNKYMAENHGLQDAKKGVIFESLPPVLHLQLKRFEYDMVKDSMVKINDRHEFPVEIDLQDYLLDDTVVKSESYNYVLHGVLVHTGDLTGGHYFAFVRPTKEKEWFKFDDDRVTPASLNEVLEDNFGGESKYARPKHKTEKRFTNAYMLVYIRESQQDKILAPVTEKDIPAHLVERINKERATIEEFQRSKAQQHLYMKAYITNDTSFLLNRGAGFVQCNENGLEDPPSVLVEQVLRKQVLRDYVDNYAERFGISPQSVRVWNFANRRNGQVQPSQYLEEDDLECTLEEICNSNGDYPFLRLYMEHGDISDEDGTCYLHKLDSEQRLIFIKFFDPMTQTLRGLCKLYISANQLVSDIEDDLNRMVNLPNGTEIDIYEETGPGSMDLIDRAKTFQQNGIVDGDILCFQENIDPDSLEGSEDFLYFYATAPEYIQYLENRIIIAFSPRFNDSENPIEFTMELRRDMSYEEVVLRLGEYIQRDPDYILLLIPDYYGLPVQQVRPVEGMVLLDILQCVPKPKLNSRRHEDVEGSHLLLSKLFFDVLNVEVSEYQSKKLVKATVVYPDMSTMLVSHVLPKFATIGHLSQMIDNRSTVIIYQVIDSRIVKNFLPDEVVGFCLDDEAIIYAEVLSPELLHLKPPTIMVPVYHFERELNQAHSIPFNFFVIKDEEFHETKKRLQKRAGINDQDWEKVKVFIVSQFKKKLIDKDDYKLSDHEFRPAESLGLDCSDPNGRFKATALDRTLFIKD